ncbi:MULTISPECIES: BON domain-containing protein [Burkholderia cepacia complex]|uniref:BON domain-containing protein n=1 Tax=Burkholderia cepacia complex TaxID=87882 RepID=UPI001E3D6F3D|nr:MULTISPECIES: BON domain-containing protein [Burkholderia cepacia complex]MCA8462918.1 BON domain-containing protein [Burkholderia multivorans]MDN7844628.1 BON domain-containing protein [Burkholderia multivorans]MDN7867703.1 BON domain-containing protein [Burkholderia multivorans]MDN8018884.1 BON domain-containing protein [Burkholderia multivorans]MDN8047097.1 BON domain-containing protein [Burkholderia multivorans]
MPLLRSCLLFRHKRRPRHLQQQLPLVRLRAANKDLAKRVQKTLYKQKGLESTDVHAVARSGKITLVGMAPDQAQIDLAGKVAESVPGVTSVKNNLTVDEKGR